MANRRPRTRLISAGRLARALDAGQFSALTLSADLDGGGVRVAEIDGTPARVVMSGEKEMREILKAQLRAAFTPKGAR